MKKNSYLWAIAMAATLFLALLVSLPANRPAPATAAPAAAVTPVASANLSDASPRVASFFDARAITADTRACFDLAAYELLDLQYVIDQGTTNTTTLKIQHSNDNVNFTDGATAVSANTADASALAQHALFGRYNCVYADVANTNTITITAMG
jgi:hypothetical protein